MLPDIRRAMTFSSPSCQVFQETADEILSAVLKNRGKPQETRWTHSDLVAKASFFRNAGTLYQLLGREELEAAQSNNLTKQKELKRLSKQLTSANFWLEVIGYTQIFDRWVFF